MNQKQKLKYSVVTAGALAVSLTAMAQTVIPPTFALPKTVADSAARGFVVRTVQASKNEGTLPNTLARTEAQLAGTLISPVTGLPMVDISDKTAFQADGTYNEAATISYDRSGNIFPGLPSTTEDTNFNNIALDAVAYLDLDPGSYSFIVNSDDGFRVYMGSDARDQLTSVILGEFDGGRGAGDTVMNFSVSQAGLYSMRLIYEQGGGGANVSLFSAPVGSPESRILVNDAGGIKAYRKVTTPTAPYVSLANPVPNAAAAAPSEMTYVIQDSGRAVNASTVALYVDGVKTSAVVTKTGKTTKVTYKPSPIFAPLSKHTAGLTFSDDASPANVRTNGFAFTVKNYANVKLPAPLFLENFDTTAEGTLPTGWTGVNYTDQRTAGEDLDDPNSDSYLGWLTISSNRMWRIGEGELNKWEALRRFTVDEQYINGILVTSLVTNNFAYAESDQRGGSQVQYMFTKDYDLTGKTNLYVSYNSMYEQNQDSMGSVEYSIDGGKTWEPIVIMVDVADIITGTDGKPDAYKTLIEPRGDTAKYVDPVTGEDAGGTYGAFLGVQDTNRWATFNAYISGRVNDDFHESKRIELFPIAKAANQKTVRFRFAQAGTGSWYFGIDNLGIYSINQIDPPTIATVSGSTSVITGLKASFTATVTGSQLSYQWLLNGSEIPGATAVNYSIAKATAADAGNYQLRVTNPGGVVTSTAVALAVAPNPEPVTSISNGLVTHLKFDGDYADASGNNVTGTPNGTPAFENGVIGKAVHITNKKDGSRNDYVSLGYPNVLKFGDSTTGTDFSVSFWVKQISQADDQAFISNKNWNSSNNKGWGIFSQGGANIRNQWTGPGGSSDKFDNKPSPGLNDGAWHLLTVTTARAGQVTTYLDGNVLNSVAQTSKGSIDTDDAGYTVNIGQDGTGTYTDGGSAEIDMVVDDLGIWRRVLTASEVAAIYFRGQAGNHLEAVPTVSTGITIAPATLTGGKVTFSWTGGAGPFKVQTRSTVNGTWTDLATGVTSPYSVTPSAAAGFFRIVDSGN